MNLLQRSLLGVYAGVKATGVLESQLSKRAFLAAYFLYKKHFEDPFDSLVRKHPELFGGGHILDIGANVGYTASVFARALTPGFRVHAFEPDPATFATLESVISTRNLASRVNPVWAAVGSSDGSIQMWHNDDHGADHRVFTDKFSEQKTDTTKVVRVPQRSVDSYTAGQISGPVQFIKIDVQGYEPQVCAGMERTIEQNPKAVVCMEYAPLSIAELGLDPEEPLRFFEKHGFRMAIVDNRGGMSPAHSQLIAEVVKKREYMDLICSREPLAGI